MLVSDVTVLKAIHSGYKAGTLVSLRKVCVKKFRDFEKHGCYETIVAGNRMVITRIMKSEDNRHR